MAQIFNLVPPDGAEEPAASPVRAAINRVRRPKTFIAALEHWRALQARYADLHGELRGAITVMRTASPAELGRAEQRVRELDGGLRALGEAVREALAACADGRAEYSEKLLAETAPLRQALADKACNAGREFVAALDQVAELERELIAAGAALQRAFPNYGGVLRIPLALLHKHAAGGGAP